MSKLRLLGALLAAGVAIVSTAGTGCSGDTVPRGGLMLVLTTDGTLPQATRLDLRVTSPTGATIYGNGRYAIPPTTLPTTLAIASDGDPTASVVIDASLWAGQVLLDSRQNQIQEIPTTRVTEFLIVFSASCTSLASIATDGGASSTCPAGKTCVPTTGDQPAHCTGDVVNASTQPTFDDAGLVGPEAGKVKDAGRGHDATTDAKMGHRDAGMDAKRGQDASDGAREAEASADASVDATVDHAPGDASQEAGLPPIPVGFTGPVAYWSGPAGTEAPSCPANYAVPLRNGNAGLSCAADTCACTCQAPTGVTCTGLTLFWDSITNCPLGNGPSQGTTGGCQTPNVGSPKWITPFGGGSVPSNGSCNPNTPNPPMPTKVPPETWTTTGMVCSGGCPQGVDCGPVPAAFDVCVFTDGDVTCPATGFKKHHVIYTGAVADTRACSACTCGPPNTSTGNCNQKVDVYSGTGCTGTRTTVTASQCTAVSAPASFEFTPGYTSGGNCTGKTSPTGDCTATMPITVCCL